MARILLWSAAILLVLLPLVMLGYRWGILSLSLAFSGLGVVVLAEAIVLVLGGGTALVLWWRDEAVGALRPHLVAVALTLVPVLIFANLFRVATGVPPIHDISTDLDDPPVFYAAQSARGQGDNDLSWPGDEHARLQTGAYPGVAPLLSPAEPAVALAGARELAAAQGWRELEFDGDNGRFETTAATFWFGFKDDVVVRVQPAPGGGSRVDVRSNSRQGVSDLGANARRIRTYLAQLQERLN